MCIFSGIKQAWDGLSGPTKGFLGGVAAAAVGAVVDALYQVVTTPGATLDPRAIGAAALGAGAVYIHGHWQGLWRYPDGSTIHADTYTPPDAPLPAHG